VALHNNPYTYTDPSGYCIEDGCVVKGAVVLGGAEIVAIGAEEVGDVALANAIRGGISAGQRAAARTFERLEGWAQKRYTSLGGGRQIADHLTDEMLGEAKHVKYQVLTQQLKDAIAYAKANGLTLVLRVPDDPALKLSQPLLDAMKALEDEGLGYIQRMPRIPIGAAHL